MKALVRTALEYGQMKVEEVDKPQLNAGEVLIKIHSVGICGTDVKMFQNSFSSQVPVIVGHEFSGVVAKCAPDVTGISLGQRVIAEQHFETCGICEFCLTGRRQFCRSKRSPGYMRDGAYAEYIAVSQTLLHNIPDTMSFEEAAVIEPMGIAAFAIYERVKILPEETVVILGCGAIALLAVQILRAAGAGRIIVTGLDVDEKARFFLARQYGAAHTINVQKSGIKMFVDEITHNTGVDVVMDFSGAEKAILDGLQLLKKDGRFCAVGVPHRNISIPWEELVFSAATIIFSYSSNYLCWKRCLSLIERGAVVLDEYTRSVFPMSQWQQAFKTAMSGEVLKVIIQP